jgi:hypothetical protein
VRIGLVADSQSDLGALERACELLLTEQGATRLLFLGGRWSDVDELIQRKREKARGGAAYSDADFLADVSSFLAKSAPAEEGGVAHRLNRGEAEAFAARIARVPDKDSLQYREPGASRVLPDLVGDRIAILVHDKGDLTREDIEPATFLLHGKSLAPAVVQIGPRFFVTPGCLAGGPERTCGMLAQEPGKGLEFVAFTLEGQEIKRVPIKAQARGTVTVR